MGDESRDIAILAGREAYRDSYGGRRDPIFEDRLLWRAQSFRHLMNPVPGQSVLEIGCGQGAFTRTLDRVCRGRNPITALTFDPGGRRPGGVSDAVEFASSTSLPGPLAGRTFDFVVGMDLLDRSNCAWLLSQVQGLLKPGGQILFYESNPANPYLKLRRLAERVMGGEDARGLLGRADLNELISELGFIRVFTAYNDFVYRPLTPRLSWLLRNLSILLENAPLIRTLAGSVLVHAQKPPLSPPRPAVSLCEHEGLRGAVSVVVPCHNEEMNVGPLVNRLRGLFDDYLHEIVLVDDNSQDATGAVIARLAAEDPRIKPVIRTPPNGVGLAVAEGLGAASGRWVLSMDCDFQHLLPALVDFFDAAAEGYDVVVGSRFSRHSVLLNYPFQKIVANRAFHALAQLVLLRRFRDLTNNLKLLRGEMVDRLILEQPGFAVNAETGLQPLMMGASIKEVPISWINRTPFMGTSSFRLVRVGGGYWRVLLDLWRWSAFGSGPYRGLPRVGPNRKTWRDQGPPSRTAEAVTARGAR